MKEEKILKLWVTRYALGGGITLQEGAVTNCGKYFCTKTGFHIIGKDTAADEESAKLDARKRKDARIKSLEKQIAKLKRLKFD